MLIEKRTVERGKGSFFFFENKMKFLFALAILLTIGSLCRAQATSCTLLGNTNATNGVLITTNFLVTVGDCCTFCANDPLCVGAFYRNYLCSTLSSFAGTESNVAGVVFVQPPSTPAPTTTAAPTTVAPTTAAPSTPIPSTFAPATPAPTTHAPMTPIPTPSPTTNDEFTLITLTQCTISESCDYSSDSTCSTTALEEGQCQQNPTGGSTIMYCYDDVAEMRSFDSVDCHGPFQSQILDYTCTINAAYVYSSVTCKTQKRVTGVPVTYTHYEFSCGGTASSTTTHASGACEKDGKRYVVAQCYDGTIVYEHYEDSSCTGASTWDWYPSNVCYVLNLEYIEYTCAYPYSVPNVAPTAPPLGPVGPQQTYATFTTCEFSTSCSLLGDGTCQSSSYVTGECQQGYVTLYGNTFEHKGSSMATIHDQNMELYVYPESTSCDGAYELRSIPLNQCNVNLSAPNYEYSTATTFSGRATPDLEIGVYLCIGSNQCNGTMYFDGVCATNPENTAESSIWHCYDDAVVEVHFKESGSCEEGTAVHKHVYPKETAWTTPQSQIRYMSCAKTTSSRAPGPPKHFRFP